MNSSRFYILLLATAVYAPLANANDTTPFQCERLTIAKTGSWVAPILRDFCEQQEASNGQAMAKILGKPRPSTQVYLLPGYGSAPDWRAWVALQCESLRMVGNSCATVSIIG